MHKTFTTILLLGSAVAAFAQGTINFQNSFLTPISVRIWNPDGLTSVAVPTNFAVDYGVFAGTSAGSLSLVSPLLPSSTVAAGLVAAPTTAFAIPGSNPGETTRFVQVRGWSASYGTDWEQAEYDWSTGGNPGVVWGESAVASGFALGPAAGPGYAIWQAAGGTNPAKLAPFTLTPYLLIPEPSTTALTGLGAAAVLIFRRRK